MTTRAARRAGVLTLLVLASVSVAAAQARLLYVGAKVSAGNGDDWIEPGETVSLQLGLYNAGNTVATSITGTLTYVGAHPGVAVTVPTGAWSNLPAHAAPLLTDPPYFELQLGSAVPCGTLLPFSLEVFVSGVSDAFTYGLTLKAGQRIDHDMIPDPIERFDEQEATFWGANNLARLGGSTAMGDLDGDGFTDLVIGSFSGAFVEVVYGNARQLTDMDLAAPPVTVTRFTGLVPSDLATGDVNADGYDDVIVGTQSHDPLSRIDAGSVALIYGRAIPWPNTDLSVSPPIVGAARFAGPDAGDRFGFRVAAGDVDGDGFDDIIAVSQDADSAGNARADAGETHLIYGRAAPWTDTDLLSPPAGVARFWGVDPGDGAHTVVAGDLDGDGFDDVALSAGFADSIGNQRFDAGEVTLIYGRQADWTDTDLALPPPGIARLWGASSEAVGYLEARAIGDFDDDGFGDLVLGSVWGLQAGRSSAEQLYVMYGRPAPFGDVDMESPPAGTVRILGAKEGDQVRRVATGDLNGDGYDDLVVNAVQGTSSLPGPGRVWSISGGRDRWTDIDLLTRPSGIAIFEGVDVGDVMGYDKAAGDVNDDGYDDLLIGVPEADSKNNTRPSAGEAYLWYGKPTDTYYAAPRAGSSGPYVDTTTLKGVARLPLACDNCTTPLGIGFEFPFYAERFSTLHVSSDGYLTFTPPVAGSTSLEACMPDRGGVNHLIAPYWDDLNPGASPPAGGVFALLEGIAPYRRLTIEWKDVPHAPNTGLITFEVTLFETTGQIHFRYKDLLFGVPALDNGASAVVGVENRKGAHGVAFSCNVGNILSSTRLVRFVPTTPLFEEHGEQTQALWNPTGHWHDSTNSCEPDQHSGERGWYYGNDQLCAYSNGFSGALRAPTVQDFPADARLAFWSRMGTQPGFDLAELQLSTMGTGGPYATFASPADTSMQWKYGGVHNLFANAGATVDLQFNFSSDSSINSLGWMVDDIQLVGCDATGAPQVVQAISYAPPQVCAGSAATADAFGSWCGDSFDPVRFQWFVDGSAIDGATEETFEIPDTLPPGTYEYNVEVTCESGATAMSVPSPVAVVQPPDPVSPTLRLEVLHTRPAPSLLFQWDDSAGADEYVVLQDSWPDGAFATEVGTAPAGDPSLSVPIPQGDVLYFLVAGRNQACGLSPIH